MKLRPKVNSIFGPIFGFKWIFGRGSIFGQIFGHEMKGFSVTNMATLTKRDDVTEVVVVEKGGYTLELTHEEADGLARLLRGGVTLRTLSTLKLHDLLFTLRNNEVGEDAKEEWRDWATPARLKECR